MILVRLFDVDRICTIMDRIVCAVLPNRVKYFHFTGKHQNDVSLRKSSAQGPIAHYTNYMR